MYGNNAQYRAPISRRRKVWSKEGITQPFYLVHRHGQHQFGADIVTLSRLLAPVNCEIRNSNSNVTDETYNSKHFETLSRFELENYMFHQKWCIPKKGHVPPVPVNHSFNHVKTWYTYGSGATLIFTLYTQPRISPRFRAINTQRDLGRTP